jgi:hypothetical protein
MSLNMLGAPSAQPDRRVFYVDGNFAHEVALSDTTLTPIMSYAAAELGVQTLGSAPNLSPDNLRIVFAGVLVGQTTAQVYYADRATATGRFGVARLIGHAPLGVTDPFMTGDCGRLYFSTAGAVFYAQQD